MSRRARARALTGNYPAKRLRAAINRAKEREGGGRAKQRQPVEIDHERPILENEDGSFSTVESITVPDRSGNGWAVIPTIIRGQRFPEDLAETAYRNGVNEPLGEGFGSVDEADDFARRYSDESGRVREADRDRNKDRAGGGAKDRTGAGSAFRAGRGARSVTRRGYGPAGERVEPLIPALHNARTREVPIQLSTGREATISFRPGRLTETAEDVTKVGLRIGNWETPADITRAEMRELFDRAAVELQDEASRRSGQSFALEGFTPGHRRLFENRLADAGISTRTVGPYTVFSPSNAPVTVRAYRGDVRLPSPVKSALGGQNNWQPVVRRVRGHYWADNLDTANEYLGLARNNMPRAARSVLPVMRRANLRFRRPLRVTAENESVAINTLPESVRRHVDRREIIDGNIHTDYLAEAAWRAGYDGIIQRSTVGGENIYITRNLDQASDTIANSVRPTPARVAAATAAAIAGSDEAEARTPPRPGGVRPHTVETAAARMATAPGRAVNAARPEAPPPARPPQALTDAVDLQADHGFGAAGGAARGLNAFRSWLGETEDVRSRAGNAQMNLGSMLPGTIPGMAAQMSGHLLSEPWDFAVGPEQRTIRRLATEEQDFNEPGAGLDAAFAGLNLAPSAGTAARAGRGAIRIGRRGLSAAGDAIRGRSQMNLYVEHPRAIDATGERPTTRITSRARTSRRIELDADNAVRDRLHDALDRIDPNSLQRRRKNPNRPPGVASNRRGSTPQERRRFNEELLAGRIRFELANGTRQSRLRLIREIDERYGADLNVYGQFDRNVRNAREANEPGRPYLPPEQRMDAWQRRYPGIPEEGPMYRSGRRFRYGWGDLDDAATAAAGPAAVAVGGGVIANTIYGEGSQPARGYPENAEAALPPGEVNWPPAPPEQWPGANIGGHRYGDGVITPRNEFIPATPEAPIRGSDATPPTHNPDMPRPPAPDITPPQLPDRDRSRDRPGMLEGGGSFRLRPDDPPPPSPEAEIRRSPMFTIAPADAVALQRALARAGYEPGPVDGDIQDRTLGAMARAGIPREALSDQRAYDLAVARLNWEWGGGDSVGEVVQNIQRWLTANGHDSGPDDGVPGPLTAGGIRTGARATGINLPAELPARSDLEGWRELYRLLAAPPDAGARPR